MQALTFDIAQVEFYRYFNYFQAEIKEDLLLEKD